MSLCSIHFLVLVIFPVYLLFLVSSCVILKVSRDEFWDSSPSSWCFLFFITSVFISSLFCVSNFTSPHVLYWFIFPLWWPLMSCYLSRSDVSNYFPPRVFPSLCSSAWLFISCAVSPEFSSCFWLLSRLIPTCFGVLTSSCYTASHAWFVHLSF